MSNYKTLYWTDFGRRGCLTILDQTRLPKHEIEITCYQVEQVWETISRLSVRGAPAIGVAAAYGVCLAAENKTKAFEACDYLATSRPTAVNLFWALDRMKRAIYLASDDPKELYSILLEEATLIETEDKIQLIQHKDEGLIYKFRQEEIDNK